MHTLMRRVCFVIELNLKISRTHVTLKSSLDDDTIPHVPLRLKPKFKFLSIPTKLIHHNKRHTYSINNTKKS